MNSAFGHDQIDIRNAALMKLYDALAKQNAATPRVFTNLGHDERNQYYAAARRRNRAREKQALARGDVPPTVANIRAALADAALMILATDAAGADQVRAVLGTVFAARPGVPIAVEQKVKRGRLRPKLIAGHTGRTI